MDQLIEEIDVLLALVKGGIKKLDIESKKSQLEILNKQISQPDFWSDTQKAQSISKKQSELDRLVTSWSSLEQATFELKELAKLGDTRLQSEITIQLKKYKKQYSTLVQDLYFNGPYDDHDAVITIQAGAGGTDAQDWAQMLMNMYMKWAQKSDYKVKLVDESKGEEAGIKNATLTFNGNNAYGTLRGEHGVHRLVRISPFNSGGSRETSFAMVEVLPQLDESDEVEIDSSELRVDTFRASGHGGQSVNTTDSAVRITHEPTSIVVSIQNEKSQIQNRELALKILKSRLIQLQIEQQKEKISELRGPNKEAAWGNQIRNYVLQPYTLVKDSRSGYETSDVDSVLSGNIDELIDSVIKAR